MVRLAFQGEPGAYGEEAAMALGDHIETVPFRTFADALNSVGRGADGAIIPVENSSEGTVGEANDAIRSRRGDLRIVAERYHHIRHCLIGNVGDLSGIKTVYSHPQALGQCRKFVSRFDAVPYHDTAGSVRYVKESGSTSAAGIAGRRAARHYGMKLIKEDINDTEHNYTRFVVLERGPETGGPRSGHKTSIVFTLPHKPGRLHDMLWLLRRVNLTRIESRPIRTGAWEYFFFVDFVGHVDCKTMDEVADRCTDFAVLGSYPADRLP